MKKFFALGGIVALGMVMVVGLGTEHGVSYTSGAPSGRTGSPGDGGSHCATSGCHANSPGIPTGWEMVTLTSNVPATGYVPGMTYDFTATMTDSTVSKFGFQISPQNLAGDVLGTLIAGPETGLVGLGGYVTHDFLNTSGAGTRSWDFQWEAPVTGTGDATFYGAFNFCNNNSQTSGDVVVLMDSTIIENVNTAVEKVNEESIVVFPNPTNGNFRLNGVTASASYDLYAINGALVESGVVINGSVSLNRGMVTEGMYLLKVTVGDSSYMTKIMVR